MTDVTLIEGRLLFTFQNVDFAEKYDEWVHYRNQFSSTCGGAKAVDFLVAKAQEIWLIEVKDFRQHRRTKAIDLVDEVALKVRDTMAGLVSTKFNGRNERERAVSCAALSCTKMRVALHLEQPRRDSRLFPVSVNPAHIKMKLKQALRFADAHARVIDTCSFPAQLGVVSSV